MEIKDLIKRLTHQGMYINLVNCKPANDIFQDRKSTIEN